MNIVLNHHFPRLGLAASLLLVMALGMADLRAQANDADEASKDIVLGKGEASVIPDNLKVRVRLLSISPEGDAPTDIKWRYGGEGLGGDPVKGVFGQNMAVGKWSESVPLASIVKSRRLVYLTVYAGKPARKVSKTDPTLSGYSRNVEYEFEFSIDGKVVKTVKAKGPDGGTVSLIIPVPKLAGGKKADDPAFLAGLTSLQEFVEKRADGLEHLEKPGAPLPTKIPILTDLSGYGQGWGYAIRHSDPHVIEEEMRILKQLGVNGFRAAPDFLLQMAEKDESYAKGFNRADLGKANGYPVVTNHKVGVIVEGDGCPYAKEVPELTKQSVTEATTRILSGKQKEVWALTIDEIGAVVDGAPEKKSHLATCDLCAAGYRDFLKQQGLSPKDFGKKEWSEVRPIDVWNKKEGAPKPWLADPCAALNVYYTRMFNNYTSGMLFIPQRKAFEEANAKKAAALAKEELDSPEAKQPWVYTYALRPPVFLNAGHSLDTFEFARLADSAFVYETANRDPRVWSWDSYMGDIGRELNKEQGIQFGVYIKPHRGATVQRTLSSMSRGARMIYWYTYGPDYFKGDSFSNDDDGLTNASRAAHILGKTEDILYGSEWVHPAEVAIVKPFSMDIWRETLRGLNSSDPLFNAAWEDAKWTYSALQNAHIPMDAIDETTITTKDISQYKAIYIPSPTLTRAAAAKIADWVNAGGTLYTNAAGLSRDEADQLNPEMLSVLGLQDRKGLDIWSQVGTYSATSLTPFPNPKANLKPAPAGAVVTGSQPFDATPLKLEVGREVLNSSPGTEVLARFADGGAAVTRHKYGKGQAYVTGFFAGIEYSVPMRRSKFDYDMSTEPSPVTRQYVAAPALQAGVIPTVSSNVPMVEGVLLKNKGTDARAVTLMNWAYKADLSKQTPGAGSAIKEIVPVKNLALKIHQPGPVKEVWSTVLEKSIPFKVEGDYVSLTLPELIDGDVLVLK